MRRGAAGISIFLFLVEGVMYLFGFYNALYIVF